MKTELVLGYPLVVVAALEVLLGVLLVRQNRRRSRVNRSVAVFSFVSAAFSLSAALMYISAAAGRDPVPFARLSWVGWLSIPAALQFVFYLRDEDSSMARIAGWAFYPFWTAVLALCLFTDLVVTDHYVLVPFENHPGPMENPLRFVGASMIFWLIIEIGRLRRKVTGIKRAQLSYFFHGVLIFGSLGALSAGFLQLFGGFGFEPSLTAYFSFPWVVLTFYAITRHRLFDIRLVVSNTLSIAVLFLLFAAAHDLLFHQLAPFLGSPVSLILSLSGVAALFFATPFGTSVQAIVRRTVLRDRYLYQDVLRDSINAIVSILDFGELLEYLTGTIRKSLQAEHVALYLRAPDGRFLLRHAAGSSVAACEELDRLVVDLVGQTGRAAVRGELGRILSDEEFEGLNRALTNANAEIVIPLRYKGRLDAILTAGPKGSGEPYIPSDLDLLDALAGHAAVAIENARLYEEAKRTRESLQESEARFTAVVEHSIRKALSQ